MDDPGETLYQLVRILFALSLLAFLALVYRATLRELREPPQSDKSLPHSRLVLLDSANAELRPGMSFAVVSGATLGRAESSDIALSEGSISSEHALFDFSDGVWQVTDLNSRNGTFVDGRPVVNATRLKDGCIVQFGRIRARFMC